MTYTVKGKGWMARWETRSARDTREQIPGRKAVHQMHRVARANRISL